VSFFTDESEYAGFANKTPSPQDVTQFHSNSDKDSSAYAQHHTLGKGSNQAAPGDHTHVTTDWTALALNGSWQPNPGVQPPEYRIIGGMMELRGWPQYIGGTSSLGPATLPFGPNAVEDFVVWSNGGVAIRCRVNVDGVLALSTALTTNQAFCFGNIRFEIAE
jgi:hypothetical protein